MKHLDYDTYQGICNEKIDSFMSNPTLLEATIHMFCGTGKSKVEMDTLKMHTKHISVLLVSSLALKDQFQNNYFSQLENEFDIIHVHSEAMTNLRQLEQNLKRNSRRRKIAICLYQSFSKLTEILCQKIGMEKVDFVIANESHYLDDSTEGKIILQSMEKFHNVKKLYFSATPSNNQKPHVIFRYSYLDGLEDNVLQPFHIYLQYNIADSIIQQVPYDGNCFFHCLAHFLKKPHREVRKECIDFYLQKSDAELQEFGVERNKIYDLYQNGIWNTNEFDCLPKIASEVYQRTITVFREEQMTKDTFAISNSNENPIHLRLKDSHYDIMKYKEKSEKETVLQYFEYMVRNFLLTGNNKIMCFHNGVEESNAGSLIPVKTMEKYKTDFEVMMDDLSMSTKKVRWEGFTGSVDMKYRNKVLEDFKKHDDSNCLFVLSSCMTLREGIDTSNANSLMWVDPKKNYRVVIQNLGRIVRKGNKFRNGSVIIPVTIDKYTYQQCSTEEETTKFLRNEMNSKNGNFSPIINFLDSIRIDDPDVAIQLENYPPPSNTRRNCRKQYGNTTSDEEFDPDSSSVDNESDLESAFVDEQSDSEYDFENEKSDIESSIEDEQSDSDDSYLPTEGSVLDSGSDESSLEDENHTRKGTPKNRGLKIPIHFPEGYNIHLGEIFSQSLCATLEHSVNSSKFTSQEKVDILVDFANKNEKIPKQGESIDGFKIGSFWTSIKCGKNANLLPQCLERSTWLKNDYDNYLKGKEDATPQQKADMLVDFANKNKEHPTAKDIVDDVKIGEFWSYMKGGKNANLLPQCLERSTWLKNDYDRYLKEKEDAKTPQEKVDMLVDFANENKKLPTAKDIVDDVNLVRFWNHMKWGTNANLLPQCLERSTWLKNDYDNYLKGKEDAKTPQQKVDMLVDFANKNEKVPKQGESIDGFNIGTFWSDMKRGKTANLLTQCLERSETLRKEYEKYCERQKKKGKSIKKVLVKTSRKPRVARNVALHRKVQESSASGIYNDENPPHLEDKNYINETLANHIPPEGKIIVLDGTKFRTSRKLNQPKRTTIVQFNDEHYNEMIDDETFGDCLVYDQLATHLEKVNEPIGMVYADICGSWKEMQPILEVLSEKEFVENAVVACTTCARDGERKTEEGLDFVAWLIEEMNERLDGKWKLIGERGRMKYGNMCTRMIRKM
jgi:superfamily II DNA or RNA helicase